MFATLKAWLATRSRRAMIQKDAQLRQVMIDAWVQRFWWRLPAPGGGWAIGYDCDRLPLEADLHLNRHKRYVYPTFAEIQADIDLAGGIHNLTTLEADRNIHLSLAPHRH